VILILRRGVDLDAPVRRYVPELKLADEHEVILVGLSGRGDKDMEQARRLLDLPE